MRIILALLAAALLSGCAEIVATGIVDARDLHERARQYIGQVHDARYEFRETCLDLIQDEADKLAAEGNTEGALALLAEYYPRLVTMSAVRAAAEGDIDVLDHPVGCQKRPD